MKSVRIMQFDVKRGISLFLCMILGLMLCVTEIDADDDATSDPVSLEENYTAVLYDNTNGLPTSEANDIAQTKEGFIWIGSYSGLIRYDGKDFERIDSTTGIGSVVCLYVDDSDRLWIGTNDDGLVLMEQGVLTFWTENDGLGSDRICSIEEDRNGIIYVGTTSGITMFHPDMSHENIDDPQIANAYIEQIKEGKDGLLYCLTNEDDYFTLRDGKLVEYINHEQTSIQGITCLLPDENSPGMIYLGVEGSRFYYGDAAMDADTGHYTDISPLSSVIRIRQINGEIWICARNGIGMINDMGFHYLDDLPMNNSVSEVMTDYEGNLWFTSSRQGVMKVTKNQFTDIFAKYGLSAAVVNSTCIYEDRLFIATDTGLVVVDEEEPVTQLPLISARTVSGTNLEATDLIELLNETRIRSIIKDSKNHLWFSTWRGPGLLRYEKGSVLAFTEEDGLVSDHIRAVSEMEDGRILVAAAGGVSVIKDDRVLVSYGAKDGILNQESLTVCEGPDNAILLGSNGGGIYVIDKDGVSCISKENGLSSGIVMRIKYDGRRDLYWLVTSNSIAYMTPDYQVHTIREFPYSNNFDLYENSEGDMWILSGNGIYVVPTDELVENETLNPVHYGLANGMPCIATSNSYSALTENGDLYIAGNTGVAKVNIDSSLEDIDDLRQSVPYIEADGKLYYPDDTGTFTVPSDTQKLTVHAYVYNYSLTDPQVAYRLVGFDREETTVNRSELDPVSYTNLPGGTYCFTMELKDAMGRGSKKLEVPIIKEKALYEQTWFYVLTGIDGAMVLAALVQWYINRKMLAMEAEHRQEAEKERIVNELQMARRLQGSMLPHEFPPFPDRHEFDLYAVMDPAREVGGDFYDFFLIDEDHLCLVMADVSGKGIPASLFMMVSKVILKSYATAGQSVSQILTKANNTLCSNNRLDMFVTIWIGILEISTGKLIAANAGHEYPAIMRLGEKYELFKDKHGLVVGSMENMKYQEYELQLQPGDKLFVYTDGLPEATDPQMQMFGTERMIDALNSDLNADPEQTMHLVRKAVDVFTKGAEQFDDLTMLCLEYKGKAD
ncbi:MAG: SpoIIE family protein phosphatase [Erysipelotrichaceae bacterium]|nr:SpoIIE family protein phosphatase [Erysipelotrichaceae bacterium]